MYGRNEPCQRTTCAALPAHVGGVHLDPTSDLYDGPDTAIGALNSAPRDAARTMRNLLGREAMSVEARVALHTLVHEIHRLTEQVAAVRVDMDRQVRRAMDAALDCEQHGKDIERLGELVDHFDKVADRNDQGRVALLGGLHQIGEFVKALQARAKVGDSLPVTEAVADAIGKALDKTYAAHKRAWSR